MAEGYDRKNIFTFVDRSLSNLKVKTLDLLQLHCPPTSVYYNPSVFEALDELISIGKIRHYGVSVEKTEEALKAIEYPGVSTVQIIFNMFRQRPMELFFREARKKNIGIIVRVPLASGLLTGKFTDESKFPKNDHRQYNRHGEAFDVGETFAGVDFKTGIAAVEKLQKIKPKGFTMAQFALKWILMHDAVSTVIAGGILILPQITLSSNDILFPSSRITFSSTRLHKLESLFHGRIYSNKYHMFKSFP